MSQTSNKEAAVDFMRLIGEGRVRDAYSQHIGPGFRHHNPWFPGDADSLMKGMEENASGNPEKRLEILRALQDGDLVAVHSHVRHNPSEPGAALVHIFRFENGRVVELWDVAQMIPEKSPNQFGMF